MYTWHSVKDLWLHREGAEDVHSLAKPIGFALALNVGDGVYWSHKSVKPKAFFPPHSFLRLDVATIGDTSCWPLEKMQLMGKTDSLPKYVLSFEPLKWSWCGCLAEILLKTQWQWDWHLKGSLRYIYWVIKQLKYFLRHHRSVNCVLHPWRFLDLQACGCIVSVNIAAMPLTFGGF